MYLYCLSMMAQPNTHALLTTVPLSARDPFLTCTFILSCALTDFFLELQQISALASRSPTLSVPLSGIGSRHVSSGEIKYLKPLVKTYGNDIEGMAGDLKLNPEQRTVGQLRRALRKAGL